MLFIFVILLFTGYIKTAAILCVVCLVADIVATVLTGLGLRSQDHTDKNRYYRLAVICMGAARKFKFQMIFNYQMSHLFIR